MKRSNLLIGFAIFVATWLIGMAVNYTLLTGGDPGLILKNSISKYVGANVITAIIFMLGNWVVVANMTKYAWRLGEKLGMRKVYYCLVVIVGVALMWLSFFPVGLMDSTAGKSVISVLHEMGSRTMFLAMLMIATAIFARPTADKALKIGSGIYMAYGIVCTFGFLTAASWFKAGLLLFESTYILGFMLMMMLAKQPARE